MKRVAGFFGLSLLLVTNYGAGAELRDPWLWPFSSDSEWNMPIGSGARFADDDAPITRDILAGGTRIDAGKWSMPVYLAKPSDPMRTLYDEENKRSFHARIPLDAKPDPMSTGHMYVVDPSERTVLESYNTRIGLDKDLIAKRAFVIDLYGSGTHFNDRSIAPGVRAMDASGFGGLIRIWELKEHKIRHALTFKLHYRHLKHGAVWPSAREDYFGFRDYTGDVRHADCHSANRRRE